MACKFRKTLIANCESILSENDWIAARVSYTKKLRKPYPVVYKTPKARFYQQVLISQYKNQLNLNDVDKIKSIQNPRIILSTQFFLNKDNRDVTNLCKLYEDALKVAIGVDDRFTTDHYLSKSIIKNLKREIIMTDLLIIPKD